MEQSIILKRVTNFKFVSELEKMLKLELPFSSLVHQMSSSAYQTGNDESGYCLEPDYGQTHWLEYQIGIVVEIQLYILADFLAFFSFF
ncbi:hypothetical protein SLEP1_g4525 [Rubroshorea leprosula]|uniref:Uncharacterized protein n=1 Tax=Rubroshorea leprosula TaxID=152421 RepID=A0AAV5HUR9_9ROSI|nr:hypothetical protein SLEP1_g4525 [Rubroshorea leprosula]